LLHTFSAYFLSLIPQAGSWSKYDKVPAFCWNVMLLTVMSCSLMY
jgi:hypothetical protein